jgi:hypothetical protein
MQLVTFPMIQHLLIYFGRGSNGMAAESERCTGGLSHITLVIMFLAPSALGGVLRKFGTGSKAKW